MPLFGAIYDKKKEDGKMRIIYFLVIGIVAAWLAGIIMKNKKLGFVGSLIVGCIGALIGGFVFELLGIFTYGLIGSLVTALVGAIILLWIITLINKK